jgi:hypothetical protein
MPPNCRSRAFPFLPLLAGRLQHVGKSVALLFACLKTSLGFNASVLFLFAQCFDAVSALLLDKRQYRGFVYAWSRSAEASMASSGNPDHWLRATIPHLHPFLASRISLLFGSILVASVNLPSITHRGVRSVNASEFISTTWAMLLLLTGNLRRHTLQ